MASPLAERDSRVEDLLREEDEYITAQPTNTQMATVDSLRRVEELNVADMEADESVDSTALDPHAREQGEVYLRKVVPKPLTDIARTHVPLQVIGRPSTTTPLYKCRWKFLEITSATLR